MKSFYSTLLYLVFLSCAVLSEPAWSASGTLIKADVLRQSASARSSSVGRVGKGDIVEILARQGGWTQVRHANGTGWVRILSVKSNAGSGSGLGGLVQMGTTRSDARRVVAVAGVRGLNEEELRSAHFNANELMRLDQYISSRGDAEQFARVAGLHPLELGYIQPAKAVRESHSNRSSPWGDSGF